LTGTYFYAYFSGTKLNKAQAPLFEIVQLICSSFLYYEEYPL